VRNSGEPQAHSNLKQFAVYSHGSIDQNAFPTLFHSTAHALSLHFIAGYYMDAAKTELLFAFLHCLQTTSLVDASAINAVIFTPLIYHSPHNDS
jgi:hypothetical protein